MIGVYSRRRGSLVFDELSVELAPPITSNVVEYPADAYVGVLVISQVVEETLQVEDSTAVVDFGRTALPRSAAEIRDPECLPEGSLGMVDAS